jgi:hypothetical protein
MLRVGVLVVALGLACLPAGTSASSLAQGAPAVVVLMASDRTSYQAGETVTFTLAVDNPGNAETTLTFSSGQTYDVVVMAGDVEVWRSSNGRGFIQVIREIPFQPGVSLVGRETWDWRDNAGAPLPAGTYRAIASLATSPPQTGNVVELTLRAR